jgi:hypothetical protein
MDPPPDDSNEAHGLRAGEKCISWLDEQEKLPRMRDDKSVVAISDRLYAARFLSDIPDIVKHILPLAPPLSVGPWTAITSITIPRTVRSIGDRAFSGLPTLLRVDFQPESELVYVGGFSHCPQLSQIFLPPTLSGIGAHGFSGCKGVQRVTFRGAPPDVKKRNTCGLKKISGFNQSIISELHIPASVEIIDGCNGDAFPAESLCIGISRIEFDDAATIHTIDGFSPPAMRSITIPKSVRIIGENAFVGVRSGSQSFCLLAQITFEANTQLEKVLGIRDCPELTEIVLPGAEVEIGENALVRCGSTGIVARVQNAAYLANEKEVDDRTIKFVNY